MRLLSGLLLLGFCAAAQAQEQPRVTLDVSVENAKLIVQTLGAIQCGNVQQLAVCNQAAALLTELRKQVIAQEKK